MLEAENFSALPGLCCGFNFMASDLESVRAHLRHVQSFATGRRGCCLKEDCFLHHSKASCTGLVGEPWSLMEQKDRFLCEGPGRPPGPLVGMRGQGLR